MSTPRYCDACGKPLTVPPDAPHKRFCSTACRNHWHGAKRRQAASPPLNIPEMISYLRAVGLTVINLTEE